MANTPTETDEFSKMFDDLAKLGHEPDPAPALVPVDEAKPVIIGETPPVDAPETPETPTEGFVTPPVETPEEEPPYVEPQRLNDADLLSRFAQIVRETPTPQAQTPQPPPQPQAPMFSAAEQAELDAYEKDWPDVAKAEGLRRRAEYHQLLNYVFEQVAQRIAPLEQMTVGAGERSHINDLYTLIPDYDRVRDPVLAWVEQQPPYLKNAYQQVTQRGTPAEIADLVGRYKQATGTQAPAVAAAAAAPAPQVRKAAAALAPVQSSRSGVASSAVPDDFDGAFAAFAKIE